MLQSEKAMDNLSFSLLQEIMQIGLCKLQKRVTEVQKRVHVDLIYFCLLFIIIGLSFGENLASHWVSALLVAEGWGAA